MTKLEIILTIIVIAETIYLIIAKILYMDLKAELQANQKQASLRESIGEKPLPEITDDVRRDYFIQRIDDSLKAMLDGKFIHSVVDAGDGESFLIGIRREREHVNQGCKLHYFYDEGLQAIKERLSDYIEKHEYFSELH